MHGVLWRWLLLLGLILWASLLTHDAWRRYIQHHPQYEKPLEIDINPPKIHTIHNTPPALTFWKLISMFLSVGALIYIKRTSNMRKYNQYSTILSYTKPDELKISPTKVFNAVPMFQTMNYCTEFTSPLLPKVYASEPKRILGPNPIKPAIIGVEIVQKKLENLEKSVASLRRRHIGTSTTNTQSNGTAGIVSGSPEFKKFLHQNMQNDSITEVSMNESQFSKRSKLQAASLMSENSNGSDNALQNASAITMEQDIQESPDISNITNVLSKSDTNSWTTISEDVSREIIEYLETKENSMCSSLQEVKTNEGSMAEEELKPILEEIMSRKKASLTSADTNLVTITDSLSLEISRESLITNMQPETRKTGSNAKRVPGSTLDSSSAGSSENVTIISSTSRTLGLPGFLDSSTSSFEEDDDNEEDLLLNTLD